jgi:hypothetical protein
LLPLELLGAPEGSRLVRACLDVEQLTVHLAITAPTAACPVCGSYASRVRSRYTRRLDDLPCLIAEGLARNGPTVIEVRLEDRVDEMISVIPWLHGE